MNKLKTRITRKDLYSKDFGRVEYINSNKSIKPYISKSLVSVFIKINEELR